ncbi:ABC1 family protein [Lachnospiraceae bacterium XBB2008]|nr:ABC1 family protein [Lachnospiraceae bacterium XBB2008]
MDWEIIGNQEPWEEVKKKESKDIIEQGVTVKRETQDKARIDAYNTAQRNITDIDALLDKSTGKSDMTAKEMEEREKLTVIKDRQLSNVLLNEEKRKNESKDMLKFKDRLLELENQIGRKRNADRNGQYPPVKGEELVGIEDAYTTAIDAALDYINARKKKANTPKVQKVNEALHRMMREQAMFTQLRMRINAGAISPENLRVEKPFELLCIASAYARNANLVVRSAEERANSRPVKTPAARNAERVKGTVKNLPKNMKAMFGFITGEASFEAAYKGTKWAEGDQRFYLNRLLAFVARIKPDVFYSGSVIIEDKVVQVRQDEDNHLTIVAQGQTFTIPGTTSDLVSKLSTTMLDNVNLLGTAGVSSALSSIDISDNRTARITDVRSVHDLSISVLEKLGGFAKSFFNNLPTTTIKTLAVHLMQGNMTKQEISSFVKAEEEKIEANGLAREHNTAMAFFLMKDEDEQQRILNHFMEKRTNSRGQETDSWYEVAVNALMEAHENPTNRAIFAEIMNRIGHLDTVTQFMLTDSNNQEQRLNGYSVTEDARDHLIQHGVQVNNLNLFKEVMRRLGELEDPSELNVAKMQQQLTFETMQNVFNNVPDQMLDVFLKMERDNPITQEEIDHLNEICKAGNFQQQMQTNMHDLELDLLTKRDEMANKLRVKGIKSIEKKQKMEELKPVIEEKHKVFSQAGVSKAAMDAFKQLAANSKEVEEKERDSKKDVVQKLIADMIFSKDTGVENEGEIAPGERMKNILKANIPALTYMLFEYAYERENMIKNGMEPGEKVKIPLLRETLERIPMGNEDGFGEEIIAAMEEKLAGIIETFASQEIELGGQKKQLAELLTGIEVPGLTKFLGIKLSVPYASVAYELEKAITDQFDTGNADLTMKLIEAEAGVNEAVIEATNTIQELFNEEQGIKIDENGELILKQKEDPEKVDRASNKAAIEREKKELKRALALMNELAHQKGGITTAKDLNQLNNALKQMPLFSTYVLPLDTEKPFREELARVQITVNAVASFYSVGGDKVYQLTSDFEVDKIPAEQYREFIDQNKTITRAQVLKGLTGASVDDSDLILRSAPMKVSTLACRLIDSMKDITTAKPEELDKKIFDALSAWHTCTNQLGGYKDEYLLTVERTKFEVLLKNVITYEGEHAVRIADPDSLNSAIAEVEKYFQDLTGLKRDYDICQKAKVDGNEHMKAQADEAETRFLDTFMEMNKQSAVSEFQGSLMAFTDENIGKVGRKELEKYFADEGNGGAVYREAYESFMRDSAEFSKLRTQLYKQFGGSEREKAIREKNPDFLRMTDRLKQIESSMVKSQRDFVAEYKKVLDNRLKIREWLAAGGEKLADENRVPATVKEGHDILVNMVKDLAAGAEGSGKFVKLVMGQYFNKMSIQDKRAMLASALREKKRQIVVGGKKIYDPDENVNAAFISGYLKGAGPLFQKMLQGVPESALPQEFRKALSDMKSELAHIPDEVVQARLSALVAESNHRITNIEVVSSLGAASVGETFLVKIYGPELPKEGKEAVVKILRPDVKNRMDREKDFMLECAKKTDKGMELTYLGKLKNIYEELDFTIEAKNIKSGEIYNKAYDKKKKTDDVEAMKLSDLVKPSSNVMLLEKAEGSTLNKYMSETLKLHNSVMEKNLKRDAFGKLMYRVDPLTGVERKLNGNDLIQAETERQKLVERIAALKRRKKHLLTLTQKWTYEGIFGEGFYHADLHSGNIQVNDEKAVVLDFGNCTKLTEAQQTGIIRMMISVVTGDADTFRDEFLKLMTDTPKETIRQNKDKFSRAIRRIFSCGDSNDTALRIVAAISQASKLGFEIPRAINDFADGAMRLQNSIDSIDEAIDYLQDDVKSLDETFLGGNIGDKKLDMVAKASAEAGDFQVSSRSDHILKQMALCGFNKDEIKAKLDALSKEEISREDFEAQFMIGLEQRLQRFEKIYGQYTEEGLKTDILPGLKKDIQSIFAFVPEAKKTELIQSLDAMIAGKPNEQVFKGILNEIRAADTLKQPLKEFLDVVYDDFKTEADKEAAKEKFATKYIEIMNQRYVTPEAQQKFKDDQLKGLHETFVIDAKTIEDDEHKKKDLSRKMDPQTERYVKAEKALEGCFADEKQGKDLKDSFDRLKELHKQVIAAKGSNADTMHEEEENFIKILNSINSRRLVTLLSLRKADDDRFSVAGESSFQEVMGDTIYSKMWSVMWQLGIPKASSMLAQKTWEDIKSFF